MLALREAAQLPEEKFPPVPRAATVPPVPRRWAEKDPVAARLATARAALIEFAEEHHLPVENLLTPDHVRRLLWTPPGTREPAEKLAAAVDERLTE